MILQKKIKIVKWIELVNADIKKNLISKQKSGIKFVGEKLNWKLNKKNLLLCNM